jgi:glycerophosphoryl diester phosphodiesterase
MRDSSQAHRLTITEMMQRNLSTPILIAHRGGAAEAPENTMAAFRHAIEIGIRFVELDVQMSRDSELIVMHDETVDRTTNGTGAIHEMTFEELRRLDAGSWFAPQFAGEKIPTLHEVLNLCTDAKVGVVIELKAPDINMGLEEKVASLIAEMRPRGAENIWCISFYHEAIRRMRQLDPALPLGYLYLPHVEDFAQPEYGVLPGFGASRDGEAQEPDTIQAFCPFYQTAAAHPEQVAEAHSLGKYVFVYTVNDQESIQSMIQAGVDGMVTDRPSLLVKLLAQ